MFQAFKKCFQFSGVDGWRQLHLSEDKAELIGIGFKPDVVDRIADDLFDSFSPSEVAAIRIKASSSLLDAGIREDVVANVGNSRLLETMTEREVGMLLADTNVTQCTNFQELPEGGV